MPRAQASSPRARAGRRPRGRTTDASAVSKTPVNPRPGPISTPTLFLQEPPQEAQPATAPPVEEPVKKRVARPPKYHETAAFRATESYKGLAPTDTLEKRWFPGCSLGEAYRATSTVFRAARQTSLETRPVSWGYGCTDGALGHGGTRRIEEMKRLAVFRRAVTRAVSAGDRLSLVLTDDHRVFQSGRLFLTQDGCAMWKPVELAFDTASEMLEDGLESPKENVRPRIVAIEAGHLVAYALDDKGDVYSWGTCIFGQLGHGEQEASAEGQPEASADEVDGAHSIKDDVGGSELREVQDQPIHESDEEEEEEEEEEDLKPKPVVVERAPRLVSALAGRDIVKLSAGNHFVVALSATGETFSWGRGCFGQLGNGAAVDASLPTRIEALVDYVAVDIAAGANHVLGVFLTRGHRRQPNLSHNESDTSLPMPPAPSVLERAVVLAWGRGQRGCLGLGGSCDELLPREVAFFRGLGASRAAAGSDHSLVLCRVGAQTFLYAFGGNQLGQLGVAASVDHVDMPTLVDECVGVHVAAIGAGSQYSAALSGTGELLTWGDGRFGHTCRVDGRTSFVPWSVDRARALASSFTTQLSVGAHHALAQLRVSGEPDRWRRFPLGGITAAVCDEYDVQGKAALCVCLSSQTTMRGLLGVLVQCATCSAAPVCRACARRCHCGHELRPVAVARGFKSECSCATAAKCVFAELVPAKIPEE